MESAQKFIDKFKTPEEEVYAWGVKNGALDGTKAYGSYEEVYADPVGLGPVTFLPSRPPSLSRCRCRCRYLQRIEGIETNDRTSKSSTSVPRTLTTSRTPAMP